MEPGDQAARFVIEGDRPGAGTRLVVAGDVDLANAPEFTAALEQLARARTDALVVDLTAVTFFGSSGINALVVADRDARRRGRRVVVHASDRVRHVLDLTGLRERLGCE